MTVAGIEVRRDDTGVVPAGSLVLTTNKRNPVLIHKGTATVAASGATYMGVMLTITLACPHDSIIAFEGPQAFMFYQAFRDTGAGTWQWQYLGGTVGDVITYYVFAEQTLTAGVVGIEMYADDGTLQFALHPDNKPLRVVDVLHSSYTTSVSYPSGPTYALAIGKQSSKIIWEGDAKPSTISFPDPDYYILLWWGVFTSMIGSDFTASQSRIDPPPEDFVGTNTPDYSLERDFTNLDHMILDVTGY